MTQNNQDLIEVPSLPGAVFCRDVHGHELSGPIAQLYRLDTNMLFEMHSEAAFDLYKTLTDDYRAVVAERPIAWTNKIVYVVSAVEDFHPDRNPPTILVLYNYDHIWYQAVCTRK